MKKIFTLLTAAILLTLTLTGCGAAVNDKVIKIGASISPHAEILAEAKKLLAKDGYDLQVQEFTDYILPNTAVENGELDANYFQHQPYLTDFNENNATHLVSVGSIHYEPFGMYAGKTKTLAELKDGASISIPNDGTNEARALFLLAAQGLITLKEGTDFTATVLSIAENPRNLEIKELDAAQLPRSLEDVDFSVINGNYALQAGLNAAVDALALEDKASDSATTYANVLVVKEGNEKEPKIEALLKALKSDEIKAFIAEKYQGAVVVSE